MVQLSVITCDHKSATLEACSQSIHLAGWLMQTRSRCAAILNHEHRDNSAILKNFKRGVLVWLKQNTVHGILRKFQIHKMTLRALGTPCIKTTLGQVNLTVTLVRAYMPPLCSFWLKRFLTEQCLICQVTTCFRRTASLCFCQTVLHKSKSV